MQIISHRGYWEKAAEKNSTAAFQRSFQLGFGAETDVRDFNGELVISHDIASAGNLSLQAFFELFNRYHQNPQLPLALNIKSDGLQDQLVSILERNKIENYFLFDMSLPDLKIAVEKGLNVYSRLSEIETDLPFYEEVKGIWVDAFYGTWYHAATIHEHIAKGKQICFVSAELHRRDHMQHWNTLKEMGFHRIGNTMLCTDFPETAKTFFHHE